MSILVAVLVINNILWIGFSIYLNSSWKDAYEDMQEEFVDLLEGFMGEQEEIGFIPKGDETK